MGNDTEHGGCHHGGSHSLFELGTGLDLSKALLCLLALIGFTVIFEAGVQFVEASLDNKGYLKAAIEKIFRELMILG